MRTENIYSVYVHKNLKNDKYYVGTTAQEPKERWDYGWGYKSQPKMWKDIQESNWNTDWQHGILGKFTDKNEALKYEAFLIAMLDSANNGYNTSLYGSGDFKHHKHSEGTKNKISKAMNGNTNAPTKSVIQYSKDGEFIAEFSSTREASRQIGCHNQSISACCKGKLKSTGGYIWKYKEGI